MKIMCPSINESYTANQIFIEIFSFFFFFFFHRSMDPSLYASFPKSKIMEAQFCPTIARDSNKRVIPRCLTNIFKQSPAQTYTCFKFV